MSGIVGCTWGDSGNLVSPNSIKAVYHRSRRYSKAQRQSPLECRRLKLFDDGIDGICESSIIWISKLGLVSKNKTKFELLYIVCVKVTNEDRINTEQQTYRKTRRRLKMITNVKHYASPFGTGKECRNADGQGVDASLGQLKSPKRHISEKVVWLCSLTSFEDSPKW